MSFTMSGHGARRLAFALAGLLFLAGCDAQVEGDAFLTYGSGDVKPAAGIAVYLIRQDKTRELFTAVLREKVAAACADYRKTARAELDDLGNALSVKFTKDPSAPSCEPYRNEVKRFEVKYKFDVYLQKDIEKLKITRRTYFRMLENHNNVIIKKRKNALAIIRNSKRKLRNQQNKVRAVNIKHKGETINKSVCFDVMNSSLYSVQSIRYGFVVKGVRIHPGSDLIRAMAPFHRHKHFLGTKNRGSQKVGGLRSGQKQTICVKMRFFDPYSLPSGASNVYQTIEKKNPYKIHKGVPSRLIFLVVNNVYLSDVVFAARSVAVTSGLSIFKGTAHGIAVKQTKSTPEFAALSQQWNERLKIIKNKLSELKVDTSKLINPILTQKDDLSLWGDKLQQMVWDSPVYESYGNAKSRLKICGQIPSAVKKIKSSMACSFEDQAETSRRVRADAATAFVESIMATPSNILKFANDNKLVVRKVETSIKGHFEAKDLKTGAYLVFADYVTNFVKGFWLKNVQIDDDVKINLTNASYIGKDDTEKFRKTAFGFLYAK